VLEIGCGQGRDAVAIARAGYNVVAFDCSKIALERAKNAPYAQDGGDAITWRVGDYSYGLPDGPFDAVYSHLSLHYLPRDETFILFKNIGQVLKPGGLLFFTVRAEGDVMEGTGRELEDDFYCDGSHVRRFFTEEYTEELLTGWAAVEVRSYGSRDRTVNPGKLLSPDGFRRIGRFIRAKARFPKGESAASGLDE
jgi:SAM-dependent methyltransferase